MLKNNRNLRKGDRTSALRWHHPLLFPVSSVCVCVSCLMCSLAAQVLTCVCVCTLQTEANANTGVPSYLPPRGATLAVRTCEGLLTVLSLSTLTWCVLHSLSGAVTQTAGAAMSNQPALKQQTHLQMLSVDSISQANQALFVKLGDFCIHSTSLVPLCDEHTFKIRFLRVFF